MKFKVGPNLSKLARWLRILGYDTEVLHRNNMEDYFNQKGITVLSRNSNFCKYRQEYDNLIYIPFEGLETQLYYLSRKGIISVTQAFLTRCTMCNSELKEVAKDDVKDQVPPYVFRTQDRFFKCTECSKVYWKATHIKQIEERVKKSVNRSSDLNIGITAGDMNGIGPQIIWKLFLRRKDLFRQKRIFIIGSTEVMEYYRKKYNSFSRKLAKSVINTVKDTRKYYPGELNIINVPMKKAEKFDPGHPGAHAGALTYRILQRSLDLFLSGGLDLIVNTPNSKESLNLAGHELKGATEFYSGGKEALMTFFSKEMKLALLTRHLPLKDVSNAISQEMFLNAIKLIAPYGKIGVLGLNPHASEDGLIGHEENRVIIPAINMAREEGIDLIGPLVPDTFFHEAKCDILFTSIPNEA